MEGAVERVVGKIAGVDRPLRKMEDVTKRRVIDIEQVDKRFPLEWWTKNHLMKKSNVFEMYLNIAFSLSIGISFLRVEI